MTYSHAEPWPVAPTQAGADEALEYQELQRGGSEGWWRPLVGVVLLVVLFYGAQVLLFLPFAVWLAVSDTSSSVLDGKPVTPVFLAYLNLALAAAILTAWLLMRTLHGLRPGWVASVAGRIRWRWFAACLGVAAVALLATLMVSAVLPAQGEEAVGGSLNAWTPQVRDFAIVILLLTPLQAAGEEYAFRGYLTQAFGGLLGSRTVAVVVPAFVFALAHGLGQDLPTFFDRFAFGLVAGVLVILTGGLEAGIAMHVLNNFLAYGLALSFGDMTSALNPTGGTWWSIPVTLTQSLVFLGLSVLVARRMGIATTVERGVLEASRRRV